MACSASSRGARTRRSCAAPSGRPVGDSWRPESRERSSAVLYRRDGRISLLEGDEGQLDVELVEAYAPDVTYTPSMDEAVAEVEAGRAEGAFLVRPLRVEEVFEVAGRGETMPQKSTYFYPKLVSGLLIQPLEP